MKFPGGPYRDFYKTCVNKECLDESEPIGWPSQTNSKSYDFSNKSSTVVPTLLITNDWKPKDASKEGVDAASPKGSICQATFGLTLNSS